MNVEQTDEKYTQQLAERLRADLRPRCPQFRVCHTERLYPVEGYCVLAESPGQFMIPSIEEYRAFCTTARFGACRWFRGLEASRGAVEPPHPAHPEEWLSSDVPPPTLGDMM